VIEADSAAEAVNQELRAEEQKEEEVPKLFVNHLPKTMVENDVYALMNQFGTLTMVQLINDRFTKEFRGFAFVQYKDRSSNDAAIEALNGKRTLAGESVPLLVRRAALAGATQLALECAPRLRGEPGKLGCAPDKPLKLYVGHIPENVNEEQVRSVFEPFGQVLDIVILRQNGVSRGCGFVHYARADAAYAAVEALHGKCRLDESYPELIVRVADAEKRAATTAAVTNPVAPIVPFPTSKSVAPLALPAPTPSYESAGPQQMPRQISNAGPSYQRTRQGPPGANLFVRNIPREFTENELCRLFAPYGELVSTKVFVDPQTNQSKCFGFVSFADVTCAQNAIKSLNGETVNGRVISFTVKTNSGSSRPY